jgi:hypothetical protein
MNRFLLISFCLFSLTGYSNEVVKRFDIGMYKPIDAGVKDLVFMIKAPQLANTIKEKFVLLKESNPQYKVYWSTPDKVYIDVQGLPSGFKDLKNELRLAVVDKLEYIMPVSLEKKIKGYDLRVQESGGVTKLIAEDKSGKLDVNRLEFIINKSGQIIQIDSYGTRGPSKTYFSYSQTENNKWLISKIENVIERGPSKFITSNSLTYSKVSGFYFPEKLLSKSTQELMVKDKVQKAELGSTEYLFEAYEVNSGKAQKFISQDTLK